MSVLQNHLRSLSTICDRLAIPTKLFTHDGQERSPQIKYQVASRVTLGYCFDFATRAS